MVVDLKEKSIQWKINEKNFVSLSKGECFKVFNFSGGIIPFIAFYRKGDIIEWVK